MKIQIGNWSVNQGCLTPEKKNRKKKTLDQETPADPELLGQLIIVKTFCRDISRDFLSGSDVFIGEHTSADRLGSSRRVKKELQMFLAPTAAVPAG